MNETIAQNNLREPYRQGKFFQVDNVITERYLKIVGFAAYAAYGVIVCEAKHKNFADLSQHEMAEKMGSSTATAKRAIRPLVEQGLIKVSSGGGEKGVSRYLLLEVVHQRATGGSPVTRGEVTSELVGGSPVNQGVGHQRPPLNKDKCNTGKTSTRPIRNATSQARPRGGSTALSRKQAREAERLWADEMMALYAYDDKPKLLQ